ncbi:fimbrial protein [Comamonas composti]|uniref:fimbrial protein n=1 Tax=Comamonas composti TaxID=408558 RepID=UPI0006880E5F|nr:fimbrial protein [Comamonas composti]
MSVQLKLFIFSFATSLAGAAAAANTITFNGEVTDQTCQVEINGSSAPVVILDSVPVSALSAPGMVAGATPFTLKLTNCVAPATGSESFQALFQAVNATSNGNLPNAAAGGAQGVSLQLLDAVGGNPVRLTSGSPAKGGSIVLQSGQTSASRDFAIQYYSESAAVSTGMVSGSVTYTVRYE